MLWSRCNMTMRSYPGQYLATAAWFRTQRAANPRLFQPAKPHILTLQAPRKPAQAETLQTGESKEPRSQIEQRLMPVQDVTCWLRYCRDTRNPHIPSRASPEPPSCHE